MYHSISYFLQKKKTHSEILINSIHCRCQAASHSKTKRAVSTSTGPRTTTGHRRRPLREYDTNTAAVVKKDNIYYHRMLLHRDENVFGHGLLVI